MSQLVAGTRIVFGATVELLELHNNNQVTYQIAGELEADIKQQLISVTSPMARVLIGKSEGDTVELHAANGSREFEIMAVRYE